MINLHNFMMRIESLKSVNHRRLIRVRPLVSVFSKTFVTNLFQGLVHKDRFIHLHTMMFICHYRVSISSTPPQFNTRGPLVFSSQNSSVPHQKPLSSTPKTPQFHTKNPSVQHKPLSSTPKTPQFNTPPSVPHQKPLSSTHPPQFHTKNSRL